MSDNLPNKPTYPKPGDGRVSDTAAGNASDHDEPSFDGTLTPVG